MFLPAALFLWRWRVKLTCGVTLPPWDASSFLGQNPENQLLWVLCRTWHSPQDGGSWLLGVQSVTLQGSAWAAHRRAPHAAVKLLWDEMKVARTPSNPCGLWPQTSHMKMWFFSLKTCVFRSHQKVGPAQRARSPVGERPKNVSYAFKRKSRCKCYFDRRPPAFCKEAIGVAFLLGEELSNEAQSDPLWASLWLLDTLSSNTSRFFSIWSTEVSP